MGVGSEGFDFAGELDAARVVAFEFELFADQRNDFAGEKTAFLRGEGARETSFREAVHFFA